MIGGDAGGWAIYCLVGESFSMICHWSLVCHRSTKYRVMISITVAGPDVFLCLWRRASRVYEGFGDAASNDV